MAFHKEHIQNLIAEIDQVLQRTNPRLPWVMSGEVAQQRQILARVRDFLVTLQQTLPGQPGQPLDGVNALAAQMTMGIQSGQGLPAVGLPADVTPYQMMQMILQEVSYIRANLAAAPLTQPAQNQSQLTAELLQILMSRLQENLSQQIAQTLETLRQSSSHNSPAMLTGRLPLGSPHTQYDQLQNLRSRSDQMLVNLDSTLNVVFESLQRNIQAYQEALSQGLERMYNMGQQSESTFKVLIEQLAQQLKQEAASYLLSPSAAELAPAPPPTEPPATGEMGALLNQSSGVRRSPPSTPPAPVSPASSAAFPYAGAELLSSEISGSDLSSPPELPPELLSESPMDASAQAETPLDSAIESWLQAVRAMNLDAEMPGNDFSSALPSLDLSGLELGTVAPPAIAPFEESDIPPVASPVQPVVAPATRLTDALPVDDDTADIDAVLKLLEDLSAEVETSEHEAGLEAAEAQLEQMLGATLEPGETPTTLPEDAREELNEFLQDDFYQSLFGSEQEPAQAPPNDPPAAPPASPGAAAPDREPPIELEPLTLDEDDLLSSLTALNPAIAPESTATPDQPFGETLDTQLPFLELFPAELPAPAATSGDPPLFLELPADLFELNAELPAIAPAEITAETLDWGEPETAASTVSLPDLPPLEQPPVAEATRLATEMGDRETGGFLSDLFQNVPEASTRSVPVDPPVMPQSAPGVALPTASESEQVYLDNLFGQAPGATASPDLTVSEDEFTRAIPEESLLPEALLTQSGINLELDEFTLSSLSEDLSSLEVPLQSLPLPLANGEPSAFDLPVEKPAPAETGTLPPAPLQGSEETLSLETFAASLPSPPVDRPPLFYQASPAIADLSVDLSMEGFAAMFGDAPTLSSAAASSPATGAVDPHNEPQPFALESSPHLFDEVGAQAAFTEPSPFTLEGMDDLFGDAPSLPPSPQTATPDSPPSLLVDPAISPVVPFTLEGMDDLFEDVPPVLPGAPRQPIAPPRRELSSREIPPFKPQLYHPEDVVEPPPPFQLEQLDNLFIDAPPAATSLPAIADSPGNIPDQQSLDAAFESLLGMPPATNSQNHQGQSATQKKKTS